MTICTNETRFLEGGTCIFSVHSGFTAHILFFFYFNFMSIHNQAGLGVDTGGNTVKVANHEQHKWSNGVSGF
jgi:hypothetical protein